VKSIRAVKNIGILEHEPRLNGAQGLNALFCGSVFASSRAASAHLTVRMIKRA